MTLMKIWYDLLLLRVFVSDKSLQEGDDNNTSDYYENLITETQARIEATVVANEGVIERYQRREEQVCFVRENSFSKKLSLLQIAKANEKVEVGEGECRKRERKIGVIKVSYFKETSYFRIDFISGQMATRPPGISHWY